MEAHRVFRKDRLGRPGGGVGHHVELTWGWVRSQRRAHGLGLERRDIGGISGSLLQAVCQKEQVDEAL